MKLKTPKFKYKCSECGIQLPKSKFPHLYNKKEHCARCVFKKKSEVRYTEHFDKKFSKKFGRKKE